MSYAMTSDRTYQIATAAEWKPNAWWAHHVHLILADLQSEPVDCGEQGEGVNSRRSPPARPAARTNATRRPSNTGRAPIRSARVPKTGLSTTLGAVVRGEHATKHQQRGDRVVGEAAYVRGARVRAERGGEPGRVQRPHPSARCHGRGGHWSPPGVSCSGCSA